MSARGFARLPIPALVLLSGCCKPPDDGPLEAGVWGGKEDQLEVEGDGGATLYIGCAHGESTATIEVLEGLVSATFTFDPDDWGPDEQGDEPAFEVVLDGEVCGGRLTGTATGGEVDAELDFRLGRERGALDDCPQ